jgi:hypothetical protein
MFESGKKKITKAAMRLMMNEKVGRAIMSAVQKKGQVDESLARLYSVFQLPSLADHQTLDYAIDRVRHRLKALDKDLAQAEFGLEKIESAIERAEFTQSKPAPKKAAAPATRVRPKPVKKPVSKPRTTKKTKPKSSGSIAPLGAAGRDKPARSGLLDLDFRKSGTRAKK